MTSRSASRLFLQSASLVFVVHFVTVLLWPAVAYNIDVSGVAERSTFSTMLSISGARQQFQQGDQTIDVTARRFEMVSEDSQTMLFSQPRIRIESNDGHWYEVTSRVAVYNLERRTLQLIANVVLSDSRGSGLTTDSMVVRLKESVYEIGRPLEGTLGEFGRVRAAGMVIARNKDPSIADRYHLVGPAQLVLKDGG